MTIHVTKKNGERAKYDPAKLRVALRSSGANAAAQEKVVKQVSEQLYDGIPTAKIYRIAFDLLKKESHRMAGRYKLKNAVMELGPTGFPFEKFVGKVFETMGYEVETGVLIKGKCVQHEVDVVARKPGEMLMVECKFHSDSMTKSSVQVPLYIHSRFLDVKAVWEKEYGCEISYRGGVLTNTRFSDDASSYGNCAGLLMISWDEPLGNSLKELIDRSGLHPLTSLISLSKPQKQQLLERGLVLCNELEANRPLLHEAGLNKKKIEKVLREAANLVAG